MSEKLDFSVEQRPELMVIGRAVRTANADEADPGKAKIPGLWEQVQREALVKTVPNVADPGTLAAVYYSYESDSKGPFSLLLGAPVTTISEVPEGLNGLSVPAGEYAAVEVSGPMPEALIATWERVWAAEDAGDLTRSYEFDYELHRGDRATLYLSTG